MRMVNLVVEVFIDVEVDGSAYAEALLLDNTDKRLIARGFAHLGPGDPDEGPLDRNRLAARALSDLANAILHRGADDGAEDGAGADRVEPGPG
jgi:Rv2632c-like